jgi:hypothetical protein
MPVADRHIGELTLEVVPGEARSIRFTDLDTEAPGITWTAKAGRSFTIDGSTAVDSGDVVVTFAADDTALMVGQPWRLYADGLEAAGEYVVPARPQTSPGTASVPILLVDESTVTVTVVTAAPGAGGGAGLSDADPEPLAAAAAPGVAAEAARIDHEHPRPSAAEVGADPAGSASTAQAAAISAAATDATTKANAAQAAAATDATTKANAAQAAAIAAAATDATTKANAAEADAATYTDTEIDALNEVADGDGIAVRTSGGFVRHDRVGKMGAGVTVGTTTSDLTLLSAALTYPANTFGLATHLIRIRFAGKILQNQAATQTMTIRVKVAGSTLFEFPWTSIPQSATARNFRGECSFGFNTFAGTRAFGAGQSSLGAAGTGLGFGTQVVDASIAATFDLTTALTFDITAQPGASASTLTAQCTQFVVDIIRTP